MNSKTTILSGLLLVAVVYAGYLQFELNALREAWSERASSESAVAKASVGVEEEASAEEPPVANASERAQAKIAISEPAQPEEAATREERRNGRRERMGRMAAVFDDPEMRVDMVEQQMTRIDERFAEFFKTLELSPDDLDTLRTLMAERNIVGWEARMRRGVAESDEDRELARAQRDAQREALSSQIEELLGKDTTVELKEYSDSIPYRREVEALASSLSFTKSPLSKEQNEVLVQKLQNVSSEYEYTRDLSEMRGFGGDDISESDVSLYFRERKVRDDQVIASAAEALDEDQLAAFAERQIAERERDQRRMEFMIRNRSAEPSNR